MKGTDWTSSFEYDSKGRIIKKHIINEFLIDKNINATFEYRNNFAYEHYTFENEKSGFLTKFENQYTPTYHIYFKDDNIQNSTLDILVITSEQGKGRKIYDTNLNIKPSEKVLKIVETDKFEELITYCNIHFK